MASSDVDKGRAWLVAFSTFIMCALTIGLPLAAGGAYNVIFRKAFPESSATTVAWATSSISGVSFIIGPVGSILVNRYGLRLPALIGGVTAVTGFVVSSFAPNILCLFFTFGVLTGTGLGFAHISGNTAIAYYFDKHFGLATGLALSGCGVGTLVFAPVVVALDHLLGWRGSLLVVGGITLSICVCGVINAPHTRVKLSTNQSLLDWSLFRMFSYQLLVVNCVCVAFGISIIYVHCLSFAAFRGYTDTESAMLMSAMGFANVVGRLVVPPTTKLRCVNVCVLFCTCYVLSGVCTCLYPLFGHSYITLIILSAGFGFFTVPYCSLLGILLMEKVGVMRFANAYGYLCLFMGVGQIGGGLTAGFLFDIMGSYDASMYTGSGVLIFGGVVPLLSLCFGSKASFNLSKRITIEVTEKQGEDNTNFEEEAAVVTIELGKDNTNFEKEDEVVTKKQGKDNTNFEKEVSVVTVEQGKNNINFEKEVAVVTVEQGKNNINFEKEVAVVTTEQGKNNINFEKEVSVVTVEQGKNNINFEKEVAVVTREQGKNNINFEKEVAVVTVEQGKDNINFEKEVAVVTMEQGKDNINFEKEVAVVTVEQGKDNINFEKAVAVVTTELDKNNTKFEKEVAVVTTEQDKNNTNFEKEVVVVSKKQGKDNTKFEEEMTVVTTEQANDNNSFEKEVAVGEVNINFEKVVAVVSMGQGKDNINFENEVEIVTKKQGENNINFEKEVVVGEDNTNFKKEVAVDTKKKGENKNTLRKRL